VGRFCFGQKRKEVRRDMRKRITVLVAALMLALTMAVGTGAAFADPDCTQVPNNKNCVVEGPGNSENTKAAQGGNPNIEESFKGRPQ
jgi:hypothetical protein